MDAAREAVISVVQRLRRLAIKLAREQAGGAVVDPHQEGRTIGRREAVRAIRDFANTLEAELGPAESVKREPRWERWEVGQIVWLVPPGKSADATVHDVTALGARWGQLDRGLYQIGRAHV